MISWKVFCKICVSVLCIVVLLSLFGGEQMVKDVGKLTMDTFLLITLFCCSSLAILALRYQRVAAMGGVTAGYGNFFSLQLMGLTVNQFMPGIYGGDVLRAMYLMPENPPKKHFLTVAIVYERLVGLVAILLLGSMGSVHTYLWYGQSFWLVGGGGLFVILLLLVCATRFLLLRWQPDSLVNRWLRMSGQLFTQFSFLLRHRNLFLTTLLLSCGSQLFSVLSVHHLLETLGSPLNFSAVVAVVAFSWLVTLLPISLNGLGIRESGLVAGFLSLGVPKSTALSVSLVALLPTLFFSLVGGVLIGVNVGKILRIRKIFQAEGGQ